MQDYGYFEKILANLTQVNETQEKNLDAAAALMADAIENDRLIHVYGGGGHTTLPVGEMFFRAGGLANINPVMEPALSDAAPGESFQFVRTGFFSADPKLSKEGAPVFGRIVSLKSSFKLLGTK